MGLAYCVSPRGKKTRFSFKENVPPYNGAPRETCRYDATQRDATSLIPPRTEIDSNYITVCSLPGRMRMRTSSDQHIPRWQHLSSVHSWSVRALVRFSMTSLFFLRGGAVTITPRDRSIDTYSHTRGHFAHSMYPMVDCGLLAKLNNKTMRLCATLAYLTPQQNEIGKVPAFLYPSAHRMARTVSQNAG